MRVPARERSEFTGPREAVGIPFSLSYAKCAHKANGVDGLDVETVEIQRR